MREHAESIEEKGVSLIAVVPANSEQLKDFIDVFGPYPFPVLGDPEQQAYKDLRLKKVSAAKSGKIIFEYLKEGRMREIFPKDRKQAKVVRKAMLSQDVYQLGGTWLIGTTGEIEWHHIDEEPADHATIPAIMEALNKYAHTAP